MLRTDDLDYDLPRHLIATHPVSPRDAARLMVLRRSEPGRIEHRAVRDLPELLRSGDRLVFNTTRVLPARFRGRREDTGGGVEGLYLHTRDDGLWTCMIKSRRHRAGATIRLLFGGAPSEFALEMVEPDAEHPGAWALRILSDSDEAADPPTVLERVGLTPLPPYILAARRAAADPGDDRADRDEYQTVFADTSRAASVAAPTAGLHFTPELLARLSSSGVGRSDVVLHVGAGTFKPVETETVEEHPIHSEWCAMPADTAAAIRATRGEGGHVVAVGTTTVRTLESYARQTGPLPPHLSTRLLITPGDEFAACDAMLTNFHLPRSTLMALVGAFLQMHDEPSDDRGVPAGVRRLVRAYEIAIAENYRFYSFGDAMLILP